MNWSANAILVWAYLGMVWWHTQWMEGGINISFNTLWSFSINFYSKLLHVNKEISVKSPTLAERVHFILHTHIYKTKILTFPNIPVFFLHQPVLSSILRLRNRNLQMNRHSQTPSPSCHPCLTTILYVLITKIITVLIYSFWMHCIYEIKIIQFVHVFNFIWQLLLVTSHCCYTPDM